MKVLILTCHTGEGHNSTAGAVRDVLESHGVPCESADTLAFLSPLVSRVVRHAHERIYRYIPKAFSAGYRAAEQTPEAFERRSLLYSLLTKGAKKLHRFVTEGGYDTIVCTHAFSAVLATGLLEKYPDCNIYTAFVATDYTCSPSVKESRLDAYFIPDESLRTEFSSKGIPTERIVPAGLPVRAPFLTSLSREEAAAQCGLDPQEKHLLLMCGSMGCGPIEQLTELLCAALPDGAHLTVICGTNKQLYHKLSRRFEGKTRVSILGFVKNVPALMDCADVYLTKPGGISVTEATAKGLPMVLVNAVAGCELYNMQYCVERGMARTADTVEELCALCITLLEDNSARDCMRDAIAAHAHNDAAERIYAHLEAAVQPKGE